MLRNMITWLGGLTRRTPSIEDKAWPDDPNPLVLDNLQGQPNPILKLINEWRLPRTETRSQVIKRVGITYDPFYRGETLLLPEAIALPGTMSAWSASAFEGIPP